MSTKIYFAVNNTPVTNNTTFGQWDWENKPLNVLVSFALEGAMKSWLGRQYATPRVKTILDSGAFSAWKSGSEISIEDLCNEAAKDIWDEVAALDVIGDPEASKKNAELMELRMPGKVMPVFHYGEPWEYLAEYKKKFNRIGLGGIATGIGSIQKKKWLAQVFARAYPCKFHGFGVASEDILLEFPFYSADTASWTAVHTFGRSSAMPGIRVPKVSEAGQGVYDLRFEIAGYLEMISRVQDRWKNELSWANPENLVPLSS